LPQSRRMIPPWGQQPHQLDAGLQPELVFPHELGGLSFDEIRIGKGELAPILDLLQPVSPPG
jgi:hypothetical protein